ncbi:MAG TPA: multidrug ABC transporter substrate-binding protein [Solibacterales bacterium]|nr:multidrug ABC transporter substrate-binding protein [Bryobacterales bacterium]
MRITTGESMQLALDAVWSHRFRSTLTVVGIVIGITTVVTVSSLLTGLRKGIVTFFQEFGPNNMFLAQYGGDPSAQPSQKELRRKPVLPEYAEIIKRLAPTVEETSVSLFLPAIIGRQPITARVPGYESDNVNMNGASASSYNVQPRELKAGRYFTPEEDGRAARVAVIGPLVAEALFPDGNALGRQFIVAGAEYTCIGVFAAAKGGFFGENGLDRQILIPLQTARLRFPQADRFFVTIKAREGRRDDALEEVSALLRKIRRTPAGAEDDFSLTTPDQIIKRFDQITGMVVLVSIAISGLGLLVGGIGVMNIMLVSVTERTKEIGVRKALGARKGDIIFQFLVEAVTLTGLGGAIGIVFSVLVTLLVSALVPSLPSETPPWAIIAGFTVSVAVGIFFGVWPAFKASRLDPVEALRYE